LEACKRMDSEKCSRRLPPATTASVGSSGLRKLLICAAALAGVASVQGQDAPVHEQRTAREQLEAFHAEVHSLTANFVQETWSAEDRLVDEATGTFSLLRPGRFVWHTLTPYEHLVIADGSTIWMYDVELEQATRTEFSELPASNPGLVLSGEGAVTDAYDVGGTYTLDEREFIELLPREEGAEYSRVLVALMDSAPTAIEIVDGLRQTTRIEFSGIEVNPELAADSFVFVPPPGVDVIGAEP